MLFSILRFTIYDLLRYLLFYLSDDVLTGEPVREVIQRDAVFDAHITHPGTAESRQVGTTLESPANVACQCAYIGTLATLHTDAQQHQVSIEVSHLYLVDADGLGFQFHLFTLTLQLIGPVTPIFTAE